MQYLALPFYLAIAAYWLLATKLIRNYFLGGRRPVDRSLLGDTARVFGRCVLAYVIVVVPVSIVLVTSLTLINPQPAGEQSLLERWRGHRISNNIEDRRGCRDAITESGIAYTVCP